MMARMDAAAKQLANIESATEVTLAEYVDKIRATGAEKHGAIVKFLKEDMGLTHGNANLVAHKAREIMSGGAASDGDLLDGQFKGAKANMKPVFDALDRTITSAADTRVVQKTGVSYRTERKQFALVKIASGKRVELGLNLPDTPASDRVRAVSGMCSHRVDITSLDDVDAELTAWIRASEEHCV